MNIFKRKKQLDTTSMEKGVALISLSSPNSVIAEQFNTVRTNIEFSNIDKNLKSIVLTSSVDNAYGDIVTEYNTDHMARKYIDIYEKYI